MARQRELGAFLLVATGSILAACALGGGQPEGQPTTERPPAAVVPGPTVPPTPWKLVAVDSGDTGADEER